MSGRGEGGTKGAMLSPAALTARLAVEFCVPVIEGRVQGKAPVAGRPLNAQERGQLGITGEGATVLYPVNEDAVLLDMTGNKTTLWFTGADCADAEAIVDDALRRVYPGIRQIDDLPNQQNASGRTRAYTLDLGGDKVCAIEMGYPLAGAEGPDRLFVLRFNALQRTGAPARQPQEPADKKKKGWF